MIVCSQDSSFTNDIARIKYITRELYSLTQSLDCSPDDEDCSSFTVKPTCRYFDFSGIDLTVDSYSSASGSSGCLNADGSGEHCYDPCGDHTPPSGATTPAVEGTTPVIVDDSTTLEEHSTGSETSTISQFTGPGTIATVGVTSPSIPPTFETEGSGQFGSSSVLNFSLIVTVFSLAIGCSLYL